MRKIYAENWFCQTVTLWHLLFSMDFLCLVKEMSVLTGVMCYTGLFCQRLLEIQLFCFREKKGDILTAQNIAWKLMEAASGFEPLNHGFADQCLSRLATPPNMPDGA